MTILVGLSACREPNPGTGVGADGSVASTDSGADIDVDASTPGIRIATLNLRCLLEEWDLRVPMIAAELAELNPDVIALQEVCRQLTGDTDALTDLIGRLESATGETYDVSRANTHVAWDINQEGIALLTRHAFDQVETVDLPQGIFPRKAVVARISHELVPLVVAVTHLSFAANFDDQAAVRVSQLATLRQHMEGLRTSDSTLLIAGDLNEGPAGDALLATTSAGYRDAWALVHPDNDGPTFPASAPEARIDYVLYSPPGDSVRAQRVQRFLEEPTDGRFASDHVGVWADLGPAN